MLRLTRAVALGALALGLTACGDDDDVFVQPPVALRLLHASPDAPAVNISVQSPSGGIDLDGVDYKTGTGFNFLAEDSYDVVVEGIVPGGNVEVINVPGLALAGDQDYNVLAVGKVGNGTLEPLLLPVPDAPIAAGNARALVVHAAPDAPEVVVYVTAPTDELASATPLGSFSFKGSLGPAEVPAGDYRIRVALATAPQTAIYDSGTVTLSEGADLLITAVANTTTGDAPISLVAQDGSGSFEILDFETPANVRVVHASPDAPAVDVILNDGAPAVTALQFGAFTGYLAPAPGTYNVKVVDSPAPGTVVAIDADVTVDAGVQYTVLATGLLANLPLTPVVLADNNRRVATESKVRVVHASTVAGPVDVYVTAPGAAIGPDNLAIPDLQFQTDSGYASLPPGSYEVTVTVAGDAGQVALDAIPITVTGGGVYTAVAIDTAPGVAPVGLILLDDFAP